MMPLIGISFADPFAAALPSPLPSALLPPHSAALSSISTNSLGFSRGTLKSNQFKGSTREIQLSHEVWFHGPISRKKAEDLLRNVKKKKKTLFFCKFMFLEVKQVST